MVLDLQLAEYKQYKFPERTSPPMFSGRRPVHMSLRHRTDLDSIVRRMRHGTWRRSENFNKQLQHFIDRKRFQQNETWQIEADRLHAYYNAMPVGAPGHNVDHLNAIDERSDELKRLIIAR